jgi:hypothetical protein
MDDSLLRTWEWAGGRPAGFDVRAVEILICAYTMLRNSFRQETGQEQSAGVRHDDGVANRIDSGGVINSAFSCRDRCRAPNVTLSHF